MASARPMQEPPEGDPTKVRRDLVEQLKKFDIWTSEVLLALATSAMLSHEWVGIKIRDVTFTITTQTEAPPTRAQMLRRGDRLSRRRPKTVETSTEVSGNAIEAAFRRAAGDGWCTITKGYAYPTQKFASFLTGA